MQVGVKMHTGGWVNVADVLRWNDAKSMGMTFEEIKNVVDSNEKRRFQLVPVSMVLKEDTEVSTDEPAITDFLFIDVNAPDDAARHLMRATQGHSIKEVTASDLLVQINKGKASDERLVTNGQS